MVVGAGAGVVTTGALTPACVPVLAEAWVWAVVTVFPAVVLPVAEPWAAELAIPAVEAFNAVAALAAPCEAPVAAPAAIVVPMLAAV